MAEKKISKSSLQRFPIYLEYLKSLLRNPDGLTHISATGISNALDMGEVQVRKDLASISSLGKPKVGYQIVDLVGELENFLGYSNVNDAVIVGAGKLGRALLNYGGFEQYGLNVVAAFDNDAKVVGKTPEGKMIWSLSKFETVTKRLGVKIGIITVPAVHAQGVCDLMVENGILAIWNFAITSLKGPEHILIHNENMAVSLAVLANHLKSHLDTKKKKAK